VIVTHRNPSRAPPKNAARTEPIRKRIMKAGMLAIAALTINQTMELNDIWKSTTTTGCAPGYCLCMPLTAARPAGDSVGACAWMR
jgi:hypothetical protein